MTRLGQNVLTQQVDAYADHLIESAEAVIRRTCSIVRENPTTLLAAALATQALLPPQFGPQNEIQVHDPTPPAVESLIELPQSVLLPIEPKEMVVSVKTGGIGHSIRLRSVLRPGILNLPVGPECDRNFYTVHDGDTHRAIAARCGIPWNTYWSWNKNKFPDADELRAGDTVYLKDPAAIYGPPAQAPKPEAVVPAGYYKIQSGDSFSKISNKFGIPLTSLIKANCLRPSLVAYAGELVRVDGGAASWCTEELLRKREAEWAALKTISSPAPQAPTTQAPAPATTQPPVTETTLPPETTMPPTTAPAPTTQAPAPATTQSPETTLLPETTTTTEPFEVIIVTEDSQASGTGLTATYRPEDLARSITRLEFDNTPLLTLPPVAPPEAPAQPTEPAPVATAVAPTASATERTQRRVGSNNPSVDVEIPYIPPTEPITTPGAPVSVNAAQAEITAAQNAATVAEGQALDGVLHPERITYTLEHNNKLNQEINVTPDGYAAFLKSIDTSHAGFFNNISGTNRITPTTTVMHWTGGLCNSDALRCASMMAGRDLSVQFFLMQDGSLHLMTATPDTIAYQALGVNSFSIGTEIEARGLEDYNAAQMEAYIYLNQYLQDMYGIPLDREHRIGHSETWMHNDNPGDYQGRKIDPPPETVEMVFAHMYKLATLLDYERGGSDVLPLLPATHIPDASYDTPVQTEEPVYEEVEDWFVPNSQEQVPIGSAAEGETTRNDPFASLLPSAPASDSPAPTIQNTVAVTQPDPTQVTPDQAVVEQGPLPEGPLRVDQMGSFPQLQHATQTLLNGYHDGKPFDWSTYYQETAGSQMDIQTLASLLKQHGATGDMLVDLVAAAILETGGTQMRLGVVDARDPNGDIVTTSSQPFARMSVSAWQHNVKLNSPQAWQEAEHLLSDPSYAAQKAIEKYQQRGLQPWRAADDTTELDEERRHVREVLGL